MRKSEIAWSYPAEALSPCDSTVHGRDEHQHMMTTAGEEALPPFQQLRIGGVYVARLIFWLVLMSSQLKEIIILNHNLQSKKKGEKMSVVPALTDSLPFTLGPTYEGILKKKSHCQLNRLSQGFWSTECEWLKKQKDKLKKKKKKADEGGLTACLHMVDILSHRL